MKRITLIIVMMLAITPIYASPSVTISVAGENTNSTTAIAAASPITAINGQAAIFVSRQTANDKVVSEVVNVELEGRYKFLEAFVEGLRDVHRGIDREIQTGYRFTTPNLKLGPATLKLSGGNFTATTAEKPKFGIEETTISYGWTAKTEIDWWKTTTAITFEPTLQFETLQADIESTLKQRIDENIEVGATWRGYFDSAPIVEGKFHSQYLLFLTYKP